MNFGFRRSRNVPDDPQSSPAVEFDDLLKSVAADADSTANIDVVVDMSSVRKVNSKELGQMVQLQLQLREKDRQLVLENPTEPVAELFELTRLNRLVEVR